MKVHNAGNMSLKLLFAVCLFMLPWMCDSVTADQCPAQEPIYWKALKGYTFKTLPRSSPFGCLYHCHYEVRCQSYNYVIKNDICEMNNRTKEAKPQQFLSDPDRFYTKRGAHRVTLGSTPSLPAESCHEIKANEAGEVVSGNSWLDPTGSGEIILAYCDMDTEVADFCIRHRCQNGASCVNGHVNYTCLCDISWTGTYCEKAIQDMQSTSESITILATDTQSTSELMTTLATDAQSTSELMTTLSTDTQSTSELMTTLATDTQSTSELMTTLSTDTQSTSELMTTLATDTQSTSELITTLATDTQSTSELMTTLATDTQSTAELITTLPATDTQSTADLMTTLATDTQSTSELITTLPSTDTQSTSELMTTLATDTQSTSELITTLPSTDTQSTSELMTTLATDTQSTAELMTTLATDTQSTAELMTTLATDTQSTSELITTLPATDTQSTSELMTTLATDTQSTAELMTTLATDTQSTSELITTLPATDTQSTSELMTTLATDTQSTAELMTTLAPTTQSTSTPAPTTQSTTTPATGFGVIVVTGNVYGAGTDALLYLELIGTNGTKSGETNVATEEGGYGGDFEQGMTDRFTVAFQDVGIIAQLKIKLVSTGSYNEGWTVDQIIIKDLERDMTYTFNGPRDVYPGDNPTLVLSAS